MAQVSATSVRWSSRLTFILAATGSAVGLGNIWKFPYEVGQNGGGAFVLAYLAFVLIIGLPLMMAEIFTGRKGRRNPADSFGLLAVDANRSPAWRIVGSIGIITGVLILSFYSVVAGWALSYVPSIAGGDLLGGATQESVATHFSELVSNPNRLLLWHSVFIVITIGIVAAGVQSGLERAVKYLMPALLGLLLLLLVYGALNGDFSQAVKFLFVPDWSKLTPQALVSALGLAFFSLSLGMGAILMYGAYLPEGESIAKVATAVVLSDTAVAILAGLVIFPIVFENGLTPAAGPGLVFQTLPLAFSQMPGGIFVGSLFMLLLAVAAITSAISLLEPVVAWGEQRLAIPRPLSAIFFGALVWLIGLLSVFSFNDWSDVHPLAWLTFKEGWELCVDADYCFKIALPAWDFSSLTWFSLLDGLTANILLPIGGLMMAIFVTRLLDKKTVADELGLTRVGFIVWSVLVRYVARVAIILIFLSATGLLSWFLSFFGVDW